MGSVEVRRLRKIGARYYWRPTPTIRALGFENVALGSDKAKAVELAERWNAAVDRALKNEPAEPIPGTIPAVIRDYLEDPRFTDLSAATQKGYRQTLAKIEGAFWDQPAATVTRQDLRKVANSFKDRPRQAKEYIKLWSIVMGHAVEMGLRADNPALGMRLKGPNGRLTLWSPEQVEALCRAAVAAGRGSVALAVRIAYETSQRQGDILTLPWSAVNGLTITLRQRKTGQLLAVPISESLAADLAAAPRHATVIVTSEKTKRPYKVFNFDHVFSDIRDKAGLPKELWFRDLRRTALTEAGRGGSNLTELQALGGHRTIQQLSTYVLPDEEAAKSAVQKRKQVARPPE